MRRRLSFLLAVDTLFKEGGCHRRDGVFFFFSLSLSFTADAVVRLPLIVGRASRHMTSTVRVSVAPAVPASFIYTHGPDEYRHRLVVTGSVRWSPQTRQYRVSL